MTVQSFSTPARTRTSLGVARGGLGLVAVVALLLPGAASAAESCRRSSGEKSVYVRSLQTNLMVAALSCNASDQYNDFVKKFKSVLQTDADHLRGFYKQKYGKAGPEQLNTFVTRLANDESERSIQQGTDAYCDNAGKLFQSVLALGPGEVEEFSTTLPISSEAPIKPCGGEERRPRTKATAASKKEASKGEAATDR